MSEKYRSNCPMANLLDIVGDKWSLIIIRDLFLNRDPFSKLLKSGEEHISTNILTNRLKHLKKNNIIDFVKDKNDHKVKHYFLTDKGTDLNAVIYDMTMWSTKHVNRSFNTVASTWLEKSQGIPRDLIIENGKKNYIEHRQKLLEFHQNQDELHIYF